MQQLLPFLMVLVAGLFFSEIFKKLHLPIIIALILAGVFVGPYGFDLLNSDPTLEFLGRIGLIFLMFIAGIEMKLSGFKSHLREISFFGFFNSLFPFLLACLVILFFGYSWQTALFVGIIFISSSVSVITSSLDGVNLLKTRLGITGVGSAISQDIVSLLILSFFLQLVQPTTNLPWWLFYSIFIVLVLLIYWLVPKLKRLIDFLSAKEKTIFHDDLRFVLVVLFGVVVLFESFGVHDIVAGFFAGLILSESFRTDYLKEQFRTIGYGFFIPIFFILIGIKTDISVLWSNQENLILLISLFAVLIISKVLSGWWAAVLLGFRKKEALVLGWGTISQLFTTLAVIFTGLQLKLITPEISSALVVVSLITTFIAPIMINKFGKDLAFNRQEYEI